MDESKKVENVVSDEIKTNIAIKPTEMDDDAKKLTDDKYHSEEARNLEIHDSQKSMYEFGENSGAYLERKNYKDVKIEKPEK